MIFQIFKPVTNNQSPKHVQTSLITSEKKKENSHVKKNIKNLSIFDYIKRETFIWI